MESPTEKKFASRRPVYLDTVGVTGSNLYRASLENQLNTQESTVYQRFALSSLLQAFKCTIKHQNAGYFGSFWQRVASHLGGAPEMVGERRGFANSGPALALGREIAS